MMFDNLALHDESGRFRIPDPALATLAKAILTEFVAQRQGYVQGEKQFAPVSSKHALHFYRAAELCRELSMSPQEYVSIQVEHMATTGNFWPNAISDRTPFQNNEERAADRNAVAARGYGAQLDLYVAREKLYGPRNTVCDTANNFSPLFRCVIAHREGLTDVVDKYAISALLELDATPIAADVFADELAFLHEWRRNHGV